MTTSKSIRPGGLFSGLSDEQVNLLTASAYRVIVPAQQFLFSEGQSATHLYVISGGRLELDMTFPKTVSSPELVVTFCNLGPPQAVGFWALIKPYFYAYSARATRQLDCWAIEGATVRKAMAEDVQMGYVLMQNVAEQLSVRLYQSRQALGRQARTLASLCGNQGSISLNGDRAATAPPWPQSPRPGPARLGH